MSRLPWPFKRKEYPGIVNPRFVSDILASNEAVIDAVKCITGLNDKDFAIISGIDYALGSPGKYSAGIFYLNGAFYYTDQFQEGLFLAAGSVDVMPQPFEDGNRREIYTLLTGQVTSNPAGASPKFLGDMKPYRINLKALSTTITSILATISSLGNAAFRNVGTTSGTVAAGDDSRFGYSQGQIDALFTKKDNVIEKGTNTPYTPTGPLDPVNKQYSDANRGPKLLWAGVLYMNGDVVKYAGSLTITSAPVGTGHVRVSHNNGANNFFVTGLGIDDVTPFCSPRSYVRISEKQFDVYVSNDGSADNATVEIQMWQYF
jgi:hypothetical protein